MYSPTRSFTEALISCGCVVAVRLCSWHCSKSVAFRCRNVGWYPFTSRQQRNMAALNDEYQRLLIADKAMIQREHQLFENGAYKNARDWRTFLYLSGARSFTYDFAATLITSLAWTAFLRTMAAPVLCWVSKGCTMCFRGLFTWVYDEVSLFFLFSLYNVLSRKRNVRLMLVLYYYALLSL